MRRPFRKKNSVAWVVITAGVIVIMSLILPTGFWWFLLGVCLIACGIWIRRCW